MSKRLAGKVAIVTGGGAGFGLGIVQKFVLEGANVLIWDINEASAKELADSLPGGLTVAFGGDVSQIQDWEKALKIALDTWGGLDVVVNNAGVHSNLSTTLTFD
jgi:3-oxoacyl-[acyl-carrier protein] reductase